MISDNKVAIIIPIYKDKLTPLEEVSFDRALKVFMGKYQIILVAPNKIKDSLSKKYVNLHVCYVDDVHMDSIQGYNRMMLDVAFYKLFEDYEYILIYQLDAYVFSDQLMYFCDLGYDYIGAPWIEDRIYIDTKCNIKKSQVGNGGFSLRKVRSFINLLNSNTDIINYDWNEDLYYSTNSKIKIAPFHIALEFAFESNVRKCFEMNDCKLPFGCHAWHKFDFGFWKEVIYNHGYSIDIEDGKYDYSGEANYNNVSLKSLWFDSKDIKSRLDKEGLESFVIYGAGMYGKICAAFLNIHGINNVCFVDRNPKIVGDTVWGVLIDSVSSLERKENQIVIVSVRNGGRDIVNRLTQSGYNALLYNEFFLLFEDEKKYK